MKPLVYYRVAGYDADDHYVTNICNTFESAQEAFDVLAIHSDNTIIIRVTEEDMNSVS